MALTKNAYRMNSSAPVSILDYGAKLDGVTDDTAAWNAALATGKIIYFPEGVSVIRNKLSFSFMEGSGIVGISRQRCRFLINSATFAMNATAVVQMNAAYQGIKGVCFRCTQPTTTVRNNVKKYPPIIDLNGHSRAELSELLIEGAWVGIRAQGNCGGALLDDIQLGAFFQGIVIDGALDSIRLNRYHFWPFGIVADTALFNIYSDGGTTSIDVGRCDDLVINSMISFRGRMIFHDTGTGAPFGTITNLALDSDYGRIEFAAGKFNINSLNGSTGTPNDFLITQTGGELKISGMALECGVNLTEPAMVNVSGASTVFVCGDFHVNAIGGGTRAFRVASGQMMLSNGYIQAATFTNRAFALVEVAGGRVSAIGLRANDKGGGSGDFIKVLNDDFHVCMGNSAPGWTYSFPATQTSGIYGPNK